MGCAINDGELTGEDIRAFARGRVRPIDPSNEWAGVMMLEPFIEQMAELDKQVLAYNQDTAQASPSGDLRDGAG